MLSEAIVTKGTRLSLIEQAPILREFQHRMANTLAILQANCRVEFAGVADPALKEGLRRHEVQILRLAELHRFFSRDIDCDGVEAADYFGPLCDVLSRSILAPRSLHCDAFVGEGVLDGSTCECLGLVIAELVMNSAKHAFPNRSDGRVRIEICAPDGMAWCCTVADNGCGKRPNAAEGAGSRIVETLVRMLNGQMAINTGPAGTAVTIGFPPTLPNGCQN